MVAEQQQGHSVADELATDPVARRAPLVRGTPMMNTAMRSDPHVRRPPSSAGLYDVLDLILDKGIVIDAFVRVSLVGIELLTIDLRVVIASVDTYLRYAEGAERLQLNERSESRSVPDMVGGKMKADTVKEGSKSLKEAITGDGSEDDDDDGDKGSSSKSRGLMPALTGGMRKMLTKGVGRIVGRIADDDRYEDKEEADRGQERQERRPQQQNKGEEDRGGGGGGDRQDRGGGGQRHRHQSRNKPQPRRSKPRARR
jgi:hypothetical protein